MTLVDHVAVQMVVVGGGDVHRHRSVSDLRTIAEGRTSMLDCMPPSNAIVVAAAVAAGVVAMPCLIDFVVVVARYPV